MFAMKSENKLTRSLKFSFHYMDGISFPIVDRIYIVRIYPI